MTDYTGNDGDNTWFTLEPKHHLVSSIWTNGTYIGLKWEIAKRRVVFEVYLTTKIKIHTRITVLDLDQLLELKNVPVNITIEQLDSGDHCVGLPFDVEQCEDDALVTKCLVKTDKTFVVPGRYVPSQKNYEFLLPKEKFNGSSPMHICTSIARVGVIIFLYILLYSQNQTFVKKSYRSQVTDFQLKLNLLSVWNLK